MQIDKEHIINMLKEQGKQGELHDAQSHLPDQVDTDEHSGLLKNFGLDPQEIVAKISGGGGIGDALKKFS